MKNQYKLAKKSIFKFTSSALVIAVFFIFGSVVLAQTWQGPTANPPEQNLGGFLINDPGLQVGELHFGGPLTIDQAVTVGGLATFNNDVGINGSLVVGSSIFTNAITLNGVEITNWSDIGGGSDSLWADEGNYIYNVTATGEPRAKIYPDTGAVQSVDSASYVQLQGINGNPEIAWGYVPGDNLNFWFQTNVPGASKQVMTLTSGGNVGIGVSDPAAKLDISGNVRTISGGIYGFGQVCGANGTQCFNFNNNSWTYMGDTNGVAYGGQGLALYRLYASNSITNIGSSDLRGQVYNSGTNNSGNLYINDNVQITGKVGIGTYSPDTSLTIYTGSDSIRAFSAYGSILGGLRSSILVNQVGGYSSLYSVIHDEAAVGGTVDSDGENNYKKLYLGHASDVSKALVLSGWPDFSVGIGNSSPRQKLDVSGNIIATGSICANNGVLCVGDSSSLWNQNGTSIYYTNGGVGIGVTDPIARLQVDSQILVSGLGARVTFGSSQNNDPASNPSWVADNYTETALGITDTFRIYRQSDIYTPTADWHKYFFITPGGNVGIGTPMPGPAAKLSITANTDSTQNNVYGIYSVMNGNNTTARYGVYASAFTSTGAAGLNAYGVYGTSSYGRGVYGQTFVGRAIEGESTTGTGYAGYFSGKVEITGDLNAPNNTPSSCTWTAYQSGYGQLLCPDGKFMVGIDTQQNSKRLYCCEL
ncbi:hypothetical protein HYZ76_00235 [Candidatus Falkowbacteria bacterium]|nr:hypothetical protein [Candidatus Falkowbacteria bacterium]